MYIANDSGTPFEFKLGAGQVIKGWDQGLLEYFPILIGLTIVCVLARNENL